MGDERRRTKRIDVEANLSIRPITDQDTKEEFIAVHATNVSSGGIAFKTKDVLPLHSFYDMLLEMSGCDKIETVIEVVRIASQDEDGTEYVDFSSGKLSLVVFRLEPASPLVGEVLTGFDDDQAPLSYRTVAITRGGQTIIPREGEQFMEGDVIYVIARQDAVREVMEFSGQSNIEIKNMMILGGSRIGIRIATELQDEVNIKLIDYNAEKAYRLAETLDKTLIINEDGRNTEAMMEEGLSNMDAFVAVTGRSETNILAAMLAKRMGVKKVIAEVENLNYINLAESIGIDTIINKKLVTASNIFRFTMSTDVQAIKCLTGSDAEVLEFIVKPNSPATKVRIKDLGLPEDTIIGGIVRGDKVFIAVDNMEIIPYDRVVVFAMPGSVGKVGYYFN